MTEQTPEKDRLTVLALVCDEQAERIDDALYGRYPAGTVGELKALLGEVYEALTRATAAAVTA